MRKLLITICLLLVCSNGWAAKNYCYDANAEGCWLFTEGSGESVADSSPNSNTGTFKGAGEPAWDTTDVPFAYAGVAPNSVDFDTTDDYINSGNDSSLNNLSAITIVAYMKPSTAGEGDVGKIVDKAGDSGFAGWLFSTFSSNKISFIVTYDSDVNELERTSAINSLTMDTWQHVAVTWDCSTTATNCHIYVNGVEVSYLESIDGGTTRDNDSSNSLAIGNNFEGTATFDGLITDVGIFSRVLTATEITEIMNYGLTGRRLIF